MLYGVYLTKERKIVAAIILLIVIVIGIVSLYKYTDNKKYEQQTVMAEQYLKDGEYAQAVDAYLKAMSMQDKDKVTLTIGLAEAYIGVDNDYDKALEVLRDCYQKTSGAVIKEKIEEVTSRKTDYEYNQIISRADKYYNNGEYDKAITEYEKAKLIKSKETTSYAKIAEAYLEKEDYDSAREEVMEGLAITQSDELNKILNMVDQYLLRQQYDAIVSDADEYIYQENYQDGIKKYQEAIILLPEGESAYKGLAQAYITRKEYGKAVTLLSEAMKKISSDSLTNLYNKASDLKAAQEDRERLLSELYTSLKVLNVKKIKEILNNPLYIERIAAGAPVYYNSLGEGVISRGEGMIIYDRNNVYYGDIKESMKKGKGVYFSLTESSNGQGYYYYNGEWEYDIPNGIGSIVEENSLLGDDGVIYKDKIVTDGLFDKGTESGTMHKTFYTNGKETGNIAYTALKGVPKPYVDGNNQPVKTEEGKPYAIAVLYQGKKPTDQFYTVEPGTVWGVKLFVKSNVSK